MVWWYADCDLGAGCLECLWLVSGGLSSGGLSSGGLGVCDLVAGCRLSRESNVP